MKITREQLKQIIKEELETTLSELEQPLRTGNRDPDRANLEYATFLALRDVRASEDNPMSPSALFDSQQGAVLRYLKEMGLRPKQIKGAMSYAGQLARLNGEQVISAGRDDFETIVGAPKGIYFKN